LASTKRCIRTTFYKATGLFNFIFATKPLHCGVSKLTALLILFFIAAGSMAQDAFLMLKKNNRTIKTWTDGSPIQFTHARVGEINALFAGARPDSVILKTFQIQRFESNRGFVFLDTVFTGNYMIGLNEIKEVYVANNKKFAFKTSEYTSYIAAGLFSVMALANGAKFNDPFSTSLTQAAVRGGSLILLGRIFHWLGRSNYRMGRKFRLYVFEWGG
jgi:hypothetical protein